MSVSVSAFTQVGSVRANPSCHVNRYTHGRHAK